MAATKYQRSQFGIRAHAIYDAELRRKLEPEQNGRYLALEVETGDYEIADRFRDANAKLRERHPLPTLFFTFRIGYPAALKLGGRFGAGCALRICQQ